MDWFSVLNIIVFVGIGLFLLFIRIFDVMDDEIPPTTHQEPAIKPQSKQSPSEPTGGEELWPGTDKG